MTTPSGAISLSNIQAEFGGSNPISMSEYLRGGAYVPGNIATSPVDGGVIPNSYSGMRMGMFRGTTKDTSGINPASFSVSKSQGANNGVFNFVVFNTDGTIRAGQIDDGPFGNPILDTWYSPRTTNIGMSYYLNLVINSTNASSNVNSPGPYYRLQPTNLLSAWVLIDKTGIFDVLKIDLSSQNSISATAYINATARFSKFADGSNYVSKQIYVGITT